MFTEHRADFAVEAEGWELEPAVLSQLQEEAQALLEAAAARPEGLNRGSKLCLSVLLCDDAAIRPLNARWRDADQATDVLAFPLDEPGLLGDVVISVETAAKRIDGDRWLLEDELLFLLIHGLLHLLGHDHHEEGERRQMEAAEQALWTALGRTGTLRT